MTEKRKKKNSSSTCPLIFPHGALLPCLSARQRRARKLWPEVELLLLLRTSLIALRFIYFLYCLKHWEHIFTTPTLGCLDTLEKQIIRYFCCADLIKIMCNQPRREGKSWWKTQSKRINIIILNKIASALRTENLVYTSGVKESSGWLVRQLETQVHCIYWIKMFVHIWTKGNNATMCN